MARSRVAKSAGNADCAARAAILRWPLAALAELLFVLAVLIFVH
jgi:hypothetical protein